MPGIARVGDRHEGKCDHNSFVAGVIQSGSSSTTCEGSSVARKGDKVIITEGCSKCLGKIGEITSGAESVPCDGKPVATIGSTVKYPDNGVGKIVSGGAKTYAE